VVNCTADESDPQVGTLTNGLWCTTDGSAVNCGQAAPVLAESDPEVGANTTSYVPRWNGSALVAGSLYDDGTDVRHGTTSSYADANFNIYNKNASDSVRAGVEGGDYKVSVGTLGYDYGIGIVGNGYYGYRDKHIDDRRRGIRCLWSYRKQRPGRGLRL